MSKKEKNESLIIKLIISVMIILSILLANNFVRAEDGYGAWSGDENHGMPSFNVFSPTGIFPQQYPEKEFVGKADTNYPYEEWTMEVTKGTIYCDDSGAIVRDGTFDPTIYYPDYGHSMGALDGLMKEALKLYAYERYGEISGKKRGINYISYDSLSWEMTVSSEGAIDTGATVYLIPNYAGSTAGYARNGKISNRT